MATEVLAGQTKWEGDIDEEGHRNYTIEFHVRGTTTDGPYAVMTTPGLFLPGAVWSVDDDFDQWAFCTKRMQVKPLGKDRAKNKHWLVTQYFTTKPGKKCQDEEVEDPLLQPPKVNGDFSKYTEEGIIDRFGEPIVNSSWELLKGPNNEWDANRPKVYVEQNVPLLQLDIVAQMIDTLNDDVMWGFPARWWKLSNCPWEKKYYGQCNIYYTRKLEYELKYGGWDRDILDEGTKALHGRWRIAGDGVDAGGNSMWTCLFLTQGDTSVAPDENNPAHFVRVTDKKGDSMTVLLDGHGLPLVIGNGTDESQDPQYIHVEKYEEADQFILGIPPTF